MSCRVVAAFLAAALIAAGCAPAQVAPTTGGVTGPQETRAANQTLRVARVGLPLNASPEASALNNDIYSAQFDSMLRFGPNFSLRPGVAETWELRPPNTWRFTIRQDLTFSNGDRLTAEDVAYTINLIVERNLPQRATVSLVQRATAVDARTVDVVSSGLDATLLNAMPGVFVLPARYHASMTPAEFGTRPIGSGPYELAEFRAADRFVYRLRSTPHPYRSPVLREIRHQAVPELLQQINGLRGGELDIIQGQFAVDQVDRLRSAGFGVFNRPAGVSSGLITQPEMELRNSPLRDRRVRQALNYAVNRQAIADSLFRGFSEPAGQLSLRDSPFFDPTLQPYPYDVPRARQLLAEAGYPNGFRLEVGIEFSPQSSSPDLVTLLAGALRDVGVEAPVTQFEQATFSQRALRATAPRGDILMLSVNDANGTWSQLPNLFDCAKDGFLRWWCNPEFDRLFLASRVEPDAQRRADILRQGLRVLHADAPYILVVAVPSFTITNQNLRGFEWTTRSFYDYDGVYLVG